MNIYINSIDSFLLKQSKHLKNRFPYSMYVPYAVLTAIGAIISEKLFFSFGIIVAIISVFSLGSLLYVLTTENLITTKKIGLNLEEARINTLKNIVATIIVFIIIANYSASYSILLSIWWLNYLAFLYLASDKKF